MREYISMSNLTFPQTTWELMQILTKQVELKEEFKKYWKKEEFDALLLPTTAFPALNIGASKYYSAFGHYSFFFNNLDMPAATIPVGLATTNTMAPVYYDRHYKGVIKSVEDSIGMPTSVQIVTMTFNDELCLRLMKEIDRIYQFDKNHADKVFERLKKNNNKLNFN